jgi:hypothetical protein
MVDDLSPVETAEGYIESGVQRYHAKSPSGLTFGAGNISVTEVSTADRPDVE